MLLILSPASWIALLLSVFRMSIRECMNEYIKITQVIIRPDKLNEKVKKLGRSEYDITILENHVDRLAEEYKTGKNCFEAHRDLARCKRRQGQSTVYGEVSTDCISSR